LFGNKKEKVLSIIIMSESDLKQWKEMCSICFENRCDFCFPVCGDQFCSTCIKRYFKEVVNNSWGLAGCKVKCPVCYDILPKEVWTKYAEKKTIQRYESFNKPNRGISRHCSLCSLEILVANPPYASVEEQQRILEQLAEALKQITDLENAVEIHQEILSTVSSCSSSPSTSTTASEKSILSLYQYLYNKFESFSILTPNENERKQKASKILSTVISLETDYEKWRELQYRHVRVFPRMNCTNCLSNICFHCGEPSWHDGMSCKEHLKVKLSNNLCSFDLSQTIRWTLANSKRCPSCCILINRDEGCNKVDCLHCGFQFCWICEESWSSKCGFYKCGIKENEKEKQKEKEKGKDTSQLLATREKNNNISKSNFRNNLNRTFHRSEHHQTPPNNSNNPDDNGSEELRVDSQTLSDDSESVDGTGSGKLSKEILPEIGVPNVIQIERKLSPPTIERVPNRKNKKRGFEKLTILLKSMLGLKSS